jgi:hypothetical protein
MIHTFGIRGHRVIARTTGTLFNQHVLHHLTATAVLHYIPDANEPGDAVRWALALAGLAYSGNASEEAWA